MRTILSLFALAFTAVVVAQTERGGFTQTGHGASLSFATDYQCAGINPANLGWKRKHPERKITLGVGEFSYSLTSTAFDRKGLRNDFLGGITGNPEKFTYDQKVAASAAFTGKSLGYNVDLMLVGAAYQNDSIGGFAFVVRDRAQWYSTFNQEVAQMMFMGFNAPYFNRLVLSTGDTIANNSNVTTTQRGEVVRGLRTDPLKASTITSGSVFNFLWYREYGLSYGRRISHSENVDIFGGIGVKYLAGMGMIDISSTGGKLTANHSLSPGFNINYGSEAATNPSTVSGSGLQSVGSGFAVDLGLNVIIGGRIKLSASYVDLGSITWNGNVYSAADSSVSTLDSHGFDNYNFFDQADNFTSGKGIYKWHGAKEIKTDLPATLRAGGGYVFSDKVEAGAEVVVPMNEAVGAYRDPVIALGLDVRPAPWVSLSTGLTTGGIYPVRVPFGFIAGTINGAWEAGFALRDITSFLRDTEPVLSGCMGLLRFRF